MTDLTKRLRNYGGAAFETTECYNGLRDEAASVIEHLSSTIERAYGLLWLDQDVEARKYILGFLDRAGQARGIAWAKAHDGGKSDGVPKIIRDAADMLEQAATLAPKGNLDDFTIEFRFRLMAKALLKWAANHGDAARDDRDGLLDRMAALLAEIVHDDGPTVSLAEQRQRQSLHIELAASLIEEHKRMTND